MGSRIAGVRKFCRISFHSQCLEFDTQDTGPAYIRVRLQLARGPLDTHLKAHVTPSVRKPRLVPDDHGVCASLSVTPWRLQTRSDRPVWASRRRPWSMPTTARANRTDGDAEAGAAEAEKIKKARVTLPVLSVLQTVLQHAAEALADKTKELTDVLGSINNDQLVAEPDVWLQPCPQRTLRRTADGSRTAQIASHGRLTACRSRLVRYPDRADDRRASLFLRRGALCILACVVQGILCA